ncbi:hypothetical protein O181_124651 [Austropuccinia psidii MF-1]|uniref:Uncharacterized protein n=1 Tax=Austropuccinia psidii MF-1 TaxID=1389203 RepID=A0A9Q3KRL5_9BASI|nr:hypothetical protein [Austropuccinia psidii MF-1]
MALTPQPIPRAIHGLRPYPAAIGLLGQFPPHQPPGLHLGFSAWGGGFGLNGLFGPFRPPTAPTARSHKGPKGAARWVPKHIWTHLSQNRPPIPLDPKLAKDLLDTNLAIDPIGPIFGHGPPWTNISAMASDNHQKPPDQLSQPSPQHMGNSFHSFIPSVLKVAGVVHIWYYIPLCTIFAQQSTGDLLRTHFHLSISRSQNPRPILKEDYSVHQSDKLWRQSEDSSRIPTTCICRSWVVTLLRIIERAILKRYYINSISCQGIKYFNTPWTTQFIYTGLIQSTCMA